LQGNAGYMLTNDKLRLHYHLLGDGPETIVMPLVCKPLEDLRPLTKGRGLIFYDPRGSIGP